MNREDIIRLAREAGMDYLQHISPEAFEKVVIFAALVASAERERLTDAAMKAAEKAVDVAIALEREACHALRQTLPNPYDHCQVSAHAYDFAIIDYGAAIRARGQA